jgi:hypothetical protein
MTEQQQRAASAELAQRMGITIEKRWQHVTDSSWCLYDVRLPGGTYLGAHCGSIEEAHALLPDYFTDHAASWELVAWLAKQDRGIQREFVFSLREATNEVDLCYELRLLTAEPSVIARAACRALGIEVEE